MEDLVGKEMYGFSFENTIYSDNYISSMNPFIGKVGYITRKNNKYCSVRFENPLKGSWSYPTCLVRENLVVDSIDLPSLFEQIKKL